MMKYKIVGVINYIFGCLQIVSCLFLVFLVIPQLSALYSELSVEHTSLLPSYFLIGCCLLLGFINVFLGYKLLSKKTDSHRKYFFISLALILFTVIVMIVYSWILTLSVTIPIYNLTSPPLSTNPCDSDNPLCDRPKQEAFKAPQIEDASSPFLLCDLDRDKNCDEDDRAIFDKAFGKCRGETDYNFEADIDGDGCVVTRDEKAFLLETQNDTWQHQNQPERMTFSQCEKIGGTAWRVDVFHEDICPTCKSCYECGESSQNFSNCPNCDLCFECMKKNRPYSEKCPGGMKKFAEISDAAIWFQCCK